jgi:glycosyltransferase involved in cell wall biosynthesis
MHSKLKKSWQSFPHKHNICLHVVRAAQHDVRAMRIATTLATAGFHVTVIDVASECDEDKQNTIPGISMQHIRVPASFKSSRFTHWPMLKVLFFYLYCMLKVFTTQADIYHASEITALPACYLAACIQHKPLIFEAYELPLQDHPLETMSQKRRFAHALMARFLSYVLPRSAAIITVSPPIIRELQQSYHVSKLHLLRNLPAYQRVPRTDRLRQLLGLSPEIRIALYQGNLQVDRGLDRLVRASVFLDSNIVIIMMGQGIGNTQVELEELIALEDVGDRVKIIPAVPYAELLMWTASADIGLTLIPLDYTVNMRMALPNKLFEYMMAGLPVLSSPLEAVSEILSTYKVGQIVPSMDPVDIGHAINRFIYDESSLAQMRKNTKQAAQTLCWEQEYPHLLHLYQDIISG